MDNSSAGDASTSQQLPGLQGLPAELLGAVLRQLDASSQLQVFRTSKLLATALLRICPRIQLTYPTQHDIQRDNLRELAPFLTEVLQNRQHPKLDLTLEPDWRLLTAIERRRKAEPAAATADAARLGAWMLGAVPLCGAVDFLTIGWHGNRSWEPAFSAALATSFPSLTSLTFWCGTMSIGHLATAINHPLLLPQLLHLDLQNASIEGQLGMTPFIGSRVQKLRLCGWAFVNGKYGFLSGLLPFPPTLTQLAVTGVFDMQQQDWDRLAAAVSSLTRLQELLLFNEEKHYNAYGLGLTALLPALAHLPSLHTLMIYDSVVGHEQLEALLELTQITSREVYGFSRLTSSHASAACSWRQLTVRVLDWVSAAYLPLHSLTHPLRLQQLVKGLEELDIEMEDIEEPSIEVLVAAELNLCENNKAGLVLHRGMVLKKATVDLLTELYLSHSRRTARQPPHPTVASSSSHSGPSTSLASSSSPEGHITPRGPSSSTGQGGQQGSAAGDKALMQHLGHYVKQLRITTQGLSIDCVEARLSPATQEALPVLFPFADVTFGRYW